MTLKERTHGTEKFSLVRKGHNLYEVHRKTQDGTVWCVARGLSYEQGLTEYHIAL